MLRRAAVVLFAFALTVVAGCGRQVTPEPTGAASDLSGKMVVLITTAGTLDFNNVTYGIAVDTCGLGVPLPQAAQTGYLNYSYAFFIGGFAGVSGVQLFEYYFLSGNITRLPVNGLDPSTTQFVPNYNGQGTQMEFIFSRADLANPLNIAQPCPNIRPAATGAPSPAATTQAQSTWIYNVITYNAAKIPLDSLGQGGATDATFQGISVDTTQQSQVPYFRPGGYQTISNPSAQLISVEVDNYP